jgi:hypothetical protein
MELGFSPSAFHHPPSRGENMTYFKILSTVLGSAMVLGGLWAVLCREQVKRVIEKIYPETKPGWVNISSFSGVILGGWTWYEFITHLSSYSFVVTFVVSLTFLKVVLVALFYRKYREFVFGLMAEPVALRAVMLSSAAIGAALLFLGFLA